MTDDKPVRPVRIEPRWPPALAVLAVVALLSVLQGRIVLFPTWFRAAVVVVVVASMAGVQVSGANRGWRVAERWTTLLFFAVAGVATIAGLRVLISGMISKSVQLTGLQMLTSSIAAWVTNVLAFSLLYWQIDRGGPESRANEENVRPDWLFPQPGVPEASPPDWRPTFVDYLFLGYTTATAFSPTDALPLTSRAKMLMMLESSVSLATIVVVAARAINVLGG